MTKLIHIVPSAVLALLLTSSVHAAISFSDNFDSYADTKQLGNGSGQVGPYHTTSTAFVVTSGAGLSSSNAINTTSTSDRRAVRTDISGDLADGAVTVSIFFNPDTSSSGLIELALYVTPTDGGSSRSGVRLNLASGNDNFSNIVNGAGSGFSSLGADLTVDNWYFFELVLTKSGSDVLATGRIFNASAAGVVGSQVGSTYNTTLTAADVATDTSISVGFRPSLDGQTDNFAASQVPEPASLAMLGLAALMVAARRHRGQY